MSAIKQGMHDTATWQPATQIDQSSTQQQIVSLESALSDKYAHLAERDILRLESKVDSMSQLLSTYSNNYRSRSPSSMFSSQGSSPPIVDSAASPLNEILPTDTQEASALLDFFRSEMVPLFPFVNISPTATPSSLLREKPILYLAILVVASQNNVQRQLRLVRVIREEVSRRFMTSSDQDLGVLEGLLVYLAW